MGKWQINGTFQSRDSSRISAFFKKMGKLTKKKPRYNEQDYFCVFLSWGHPHSSMFHFSEAFKTKAGDKSRLWDAADFQRARQFWLVLQPPVAQHGVIGVTGFRQLQRLWVCVCAHDETTFPCAPSSLLPVTVVGEFVVAGKGDQHAKPNSQRETDLRCCLDPNLRAIKQPYLCEVVNKRHRRGGRKAIIRDNCRKLIQR